MNVKKKTPVCQTKCVSTSRAATGVTATQALDGSLAIGVLQGAVKNVKVNAVMLHYIHKPLDGDVMFVARNRCSVDYF